MPTSLLNRSPSSIRRIHILGVAGSGKSTLARRLSQCLDAPCYDLDTIGYDKGAGAKRSLEQRRADIQQILAQPAWITEGAFLWWAGDLLAQTDLIVWLDVPWPIAYWRIVKRHILADLARNNRHPGFRNRLRFARGVRPYCLDPVAYKPSAEDDDGGNRAAILEVLCPYPDKVVPCRRTADVQDLLKRLAEGRKESFSF